MPITATLYTNDSDFPESLECLANGWRGSRCYGINTDDLSRAIMAPGLPKRGDPWSPLIPNLRVVSIGPGKYIGGRDASGDGDGGLICMPVRFETPGLSRWVVPAGPQDAWTEVRTTIDKVNIRYPVTRLAPIEIGPVTPINNGDGAEVEVASIELSVHTYQRPTVPIPIHRILDLVTPACRINGDAVNVPNVMHTRAAWAFDARSLLFLGIGSMQELPAGPGQSEGWLEIVYNLRAARNFNYQWRSQDAQGRRARDYTDLLYDDGDFTGLWPQ